MSAKLAEKYLREDTIAINCRRDYVVKEIICLIVARSRYMDLGMFVNYRIAFMRQFYDSAAFPFEERKRKIEMAEPPFDPTYTEEGDPPFLQEWMEADQSLDVLGQLCVSLLAASLHLYLKEWLKNLHRYYVGPKLSALKNVEEYRSVFNKNGWFKGYKVYFLNELNINWEDSPANHTILEQVVLARNRAQHPDDITTILIHHSAHDLKKLRKVFFVDEREVESVISIDEESKLWLLPPPLKVSREKFCAALNEMDVFCDWLEKQFSDWDAS